MPKYLDVPPIMNGQNNAVACTRCGAYICPQYQDVHENTMHPRDMVAGWKEPVITRNVDPFAGRALDKVTAWLNDPRLHSDPGTLGDMYEAIRQTGRHVSTEPLACCSHDDDREPGAYSS